MNDHRSLVTPIEAGMVLLTIAGIVSLGRLVTGSSAFVLTMIMAAAVVHVIAWAGRRAHLSLVTTAVLSAWALGLAIVWALFPHHVFLGLPTRATLHEITHALSTASTEFRSVRAPAPYTPGFALAGAAAIGAAAFLVDWAACRLRTTAEACVPSLALLVFSAALAQGHSTVIAALSWLAALVAFLVLRETGMDQPATTWFANRRERGAAALTRVGALLGVPVVLVTGLVGVYLPTGALVDWHHLSGPGARVTVNPLVDIRSRLVEQSNTEVFTVRASAPAYWRLTSLDHFTGTGWSLEDAYTHASASLSAPVAESKGAAVVPVNAAFSISNLASIWLPAPFRPVRYQGPGGVSYSPGSASLVANQLSANGLSYSVDALAHTPSNAALQASQSTTSDPTLAQDLDLPAVPPLVVETAQRVTAGARTDYERAIDLQDFFRTQFTYSLSVPADDSENALVAFLENRQGFCQQFAGTYAVMARALGMPARVAVGFTTGDYNPSDGLYHVRDRHAHAWPEVWFSRIGWVAFEPTPGRGIPGAEAYTGVPPEQAGPFNPAPSGSVGVLTPNPAQTSAQPQTPGGHPLGTTPSPQGRTHTANGARKSRGHTTTVLGWLLGAAAVALALTVAVWRRRRRAAPAQNPPARVMAAWANARRALEGAGIEALPSDTPTEYAVRVGAGEGISDELAAATALLSDEVVALSYAEAIPSPEQAEAAEQATALIKAELRAMRTRAERVLGALRDQVRTGV